MSFVHNGMCGKVIKDFNINRIIQSKSQINCEIKPNKGKIIYFGANTNHIF